MHNETEHHSGYAMYAKTAIALLALTAINISIATVIQSRLGTGLVILVASIQAAIALTWFMHLRFDNKLFMLLVVVVFLLFGIVLVITSFDYLFR